MNEPRLSGHWEGNPNGRDGEGNRVPAGVRFPLMQEAAATSDGLWGKQFSEGLESGNACS